MQTLSNKMHVDAVMNGTAVEPVVRRSRSRPRSSRIAPAFPRNYARHQDLMRVARRALRWLRANPGKFPHDAPGHIQQAILVAQAFNR